MSKRGNIRKERGPYLGPLLHSLARRIGARVVVEGKWGYAGQIRFKNGRTRYWRYNALDINPLGATEIAKDKDYANFFMKRMGYPVVPGSKTFFSDEWCEAIGSREDGNAAVTYAKKLGWPVMVKPNSGSRGTGVAKVYTERELRAALKVIFTKDPIALVQKPVAGRDYRLVVLDNEVISAYERLPLSVLGDGRSTIAQLLAKKQKEFVRTGRDTKLKLDDQRMQAKLNRQKLSLRSVPGKGERVYLLDNANLSAGGDSVDVTSVVHPEFAKMAIALTRDMGLRLCGVDLMVKGSISDAPKKYWVLEINAAPGLDHYVTTGKEQQKIVEDLYLKVLKALEK